METGFPGRNHVLLSLWLMMVLFFSTVINNHNDIVKQWVAVKCALDGVSPYSLALKVLDAKIGPVKAKTINLWEIRGYVDGGEAGGQGLCRPTDATYSPAALGFLMLAVGGFDKDYQVVVFWFLLNMLAIVCIFRSQTMRVLDEGGSWFGMRKSLLVFVAYFPVVFTLQIGQFSLLVLAGVLCALDYEEKPIISGFFMFLMLLKPTLGVPLMALFLGVQYWRAMAFALFLCMLSSLVLSHLTQIGVVELYRQWLDVGWYYGLNKTWSLQPNIPWYVKYVLLVTSFLCVALAKLVYGRFAVLLAGVFAIAWSYNQVYDFVLCLPLFVVLLVGKIGEFNVYQSVLWGSVMRYVGAGVFSLVSLSSVVWCLIVLRVIRGAERFFGSTAERFSDSSRGMSLKILLMMAVLVLVAGLWDKYVLRRFPSKIAVIRGMGGQK